MKKMKKNAARIITAVFVLFYTVSISFAQPGQSLADRLLQNDEYKSQWEAIEKMQAEQRTEAEIIEYLHAKFMERLRPSGDSSCPVYRGPGNTPHITAACSGLGVENGWGAWTARTGTYLIGSVTWTAATPTAPRFNITNGPGTDGCSPGGGGPVIPNVCPGFGSNSIRLGEYQATGDQGGCTFLGAGGCVEELSYPLTVTAADTNFVYAYALVFEDNGHLPTDQPFVSFGIYDQSGNLIPNCGYQKYIAGGGLPGFYTASCALNSITYYKPWTLVGVNLSAYIGQTLNIVITNADCAGGGHYAHSYWDFKCGTLDNGSLSNENCGASICGPVDANIAYTYQWYQNGNPYTGPPSATAQCITPTVQSGDVFSVTVTQPSGCTFNLVFTPQPANPITASTTVTSATCGASDGTATATATGGSGYTYAWNTTPAQNTATATGLTAGTYIVTVTDAGGCSDTAAATIVSGGGMMAFFTATDASCGAINGTATANPSGGTTPYTYSWSNGATTASISGLAAGSYSVTVMDASGCSAIATSTVSATASVNATVSGDTALCAGDSTILTAAGGTTFAWSTLETTASITVNAAGTYSVVVSSGTCADTVSITVTLSPAPVAAITGNTSICPGDTLTLTASGGTGYSWSTGSTNASIFLTPAATAPYMVTVTDASGCSDTASLTITVEPGLTASISGPAFFCTGQNTVLTASGGNSYLWSTTETTSSITVNTAGSYSVIASSGNCSDTVSVTITSVNPPVASVTGDLTVCEGSATTLLASGGAAYDWNTGDTTASVSLSPAASATYAVTVTNSNGCTDSVSVSVLVNPLPVASFTSLPVCLGVPMTFTDQSTMPLGGAIASWQWNFGDGAQSSTQNPSHSYTTPGTFSATLIVSSDSGCLNSISKSVIVNPIPVAIFSYEPETPTVQDMIVNFYDNSTGNPVQWLWRFFDNDSLVERGSSTEQHPTFNFASGSSDPFIYFLGDTGYYPVHLEVTSANGCTDTIEHLVRVEGVFYINTPNAFTPNGDGKNDFFFPSGIGIQPEKDFHLYVFNRWGDLIFESKNLSNPWDGTWKNTPVKQGVYVWMLQLREEEGRKHRYIGHVTLVR